MSEVSLNGYILEDQIGFKLRVANQKHLEIFAARFPEVTPTQFSALVKLAECGVLSQNHLGRLVAMDAATTKGVVDRLRKKGWVATQPSTSDLRRLDVSLTVEGQAFVERALPVAHGVTVETLKNLTAAEVRQLRTLLDKI